MNRRSRTLAGCLALAATTLSFAESVLASACAPTGSMAEMLGMPPGAMNMDDSEADPMPGMPMPTSDADDDDGGRATECPLGPALGPGCSGVASLPAPQPRGESPIRAGSWRVDFDDVRADPLLTHALFRPPRA